MGESNLTTLSIALNSVHLASPNPNPNPNPNANPNPSPSPNPNPNLNQVHFVPTNLSFAYYVQPTNISSLTPTGGTLSGGTSITVRGEGFAAFSTHASKVRCRWGEDTNGTLLPDVAAANGSYHDTVATRLQP